MPEQQDKGDGAPGGRAGDSRNRQIIYAPPEQLHQSSDKQGGQRRKQNGGRAGNRHLPEQGGPQFHISGSHSAAIEGQEQENHQHPDILMSREMQNQAGHNQRPGEPVGDAPRAQVVQRDGQRGGKEQGPGHAGNGTVRTAGEIKKVSLSSATLFYLLEKNMLEFVCRVPPSPCICRLRAAVSL